MLPTVTSVIITAIAPGATEVSFLSVGVSLIFFLTLSEVLTAAKRHKLKLFGQHLYVVIVPLLIVFGLLMVMKGVEAIPY